MLDRQHSCECTRRTCQARLIVLSTTALDADEDKWHYQINTARIHRMQEVGGAMKNEEKAEEEEQVL